MAAFFSGRENVLLGTKKGQLWFSRRKQWLLNSVERPLSINTEKKQELFSRSFFLFCQIQSQSFLETKRIKTGRRRGGREASSLDSVGSSLFEALFKKLYYLNFAFDALHRTLCFLDRRRVQKVRPLLYVKLTLLNALSRIFRDVLESACLWVSSKELNK